MSRSLISALTLGFVAIFALTSCASAPEKNENTRKSASVSKPKKKRKKIKASPKLEIAHAKVETFSTEPLKGPITIERLAQLELEELNRKPANVPSKLPAKKSVAKVSKTMPVVRQTHASLSNVIAAELETNDRGSFTGGGGSILSGMLAEKEIPVVANEPGVVGNSQVNLRTLNNFESSSKMQVAVANDSPVIFDIPVTYNERVSQWIKYFQTEGRRSFRLWLERSNRYLPYMQAQLEKAGLPLDLVYVAMIESGFRPDAESHMKAVGLWQFISSTGRRYGLGINWWLDERRDYQKSTRAAIAYMKDLNEQFDSWYLVAASYNMGENGVRRLIKKHGTNNFWDLADKGALPRETTDYVPKILAALLIAKAPALYGFRDLSPHAALNYDTVRVPGGTDLVNLATYLGVSEKHLQELNPELTRGFVPRDVRGHSIRVPKGATLMVSKYIRTVSEGHPIAAGEAKQTTN